MMSRRHLLGFSAAGLALPGEARAQPAYPARPVRLVIPVAPGGLTDQLGRAVAAALGPRLGQPVVPDNRAGASMIIGTQAAAGAEADGHTLLVGSASSLVLNALLRRQLPYDPRRDFTVLTVLVEVPFVLVVHPGMPVRNLEEFVALARRDQGSATYGSAGVGTSPHLAAEMLSLVSGAELTHIPFSGNAPALTAVLSGAVGALFDTVITAEPFIREGRLRPLAVTTRERVLALPAVPTIAESSYPGYENASWQGIAVSRRTPPALVGRLRAATDAVLEESDFRERFTRAGLIVQHPRDGEAIEAYLDADRARWAEVIARRNLVLD